MKRLSPKNNCYRAILAQVNYLDRFIQQRNKLKEIYEDLTELAFYMLENDSEQVIKGIVHIKDGILEMEEHFSRICSQDEPARLIIAEIKTHLDYLLLEYRQEGDCSTSLPRVNITQSGNK